ncbi:MAG: hypothetical protein RR630_04760 [Coprobacillus sp.]
MSTKREIKEMCYLETLETSVVSVEMILNRLNQIESKKGVFDLNILAKDKAITVLDLELSLATTCILLRKMAENLFITIPEELRKDLNSIIHSNRFEYENEVVVYSQKGKEEVDLNHLLTFCHSILSFDKLS